jgi:anti-sigma regulatory factor (Ser/Thr protein kinase)
VIKQTVQLTRDPTAAAAARAWLTDVLGEPAGDDQVRADLLVMVSELVANVIQHTDSVPVLAVLHGVGSVRIEVSDQDLRRPEMPDARPERIGGNGQRIIDAWSHRWGVDVHPTDGKTVWFVVRQPAGTGAQ